MLRLRAASVPSGGADVERRGRDANGELPADFVAAADACHGGSDEGRGMLQLIHDVAPGAAQAFHTAFNSRFNFACGIMELGGIDTAHPPGSDPRKLLKIRR